VNQVIADHDVKLQAKAAQETLHLLYVLLLNCLLNQIKEITPSLAHM
jgi:hypothetical protein